MPLSISLDAPQKKLISTELQKIVDSFNGVSSTPIDWAAIFAALLPVLLQLLPTIFGSLNSSSATSSLDQSQKIAIASEIQTVIDNLNGNTSTPIDWAAIITALLPVLIQLIPVIFGGSPTT